MPTWPPMSDGGRPCEQEDKSRLTRRFPVGGSLGLSFTLEIRPAGARQCPQHQEWRRLDPRGVFWVALRIGLHCRPFEGL